MYNKKKIIFMVMASLALNSTVLANAIPVNINRVPVKETMDGEKNQSNKAMKDIKVSGVIVDEKGVPMVGVNVLVKGTTSGAITDLDGAFSLEAPENGSLVITYIGYETQILAINGKSSFKIKLTPDSKSLNEVVVVGYASQKKKNITGSVATMKVSEDIRLAATTSAGNILAGRMPGVVVGIPGGVPGSQPSISIRTGSSFVTQNVLYVIDGAIKGSGDFNNLAPNEIETITVLKDAAAAAVYGSRSAGGVIVVTTRKGEVGKMKIDYSYSYGQDSRLKGKSLTSAVELGQLYNRMYPSTDAGYYTQADFDHLKTINGGYGYDHLKELWKAPSIETQNFGLSGGSDKIKYFAGISNVKDKSFLESYNYEKTNVRFNTTVKVTDNLQFYAGMAFSKTHNNADHLEGSDAMYQKLSVWQPWQPFLTDGGKFAYTGWAYGNPAGESKNMGGYVTNDTFKPDMNLSLTYKIPYVTGLSAKASYVASWTNSHRDDYGKFYPLAVLPQSANGYIVDTNDANIIRYAKTANFTNPYLYKKASWSNDYQVNLQLSYDRTFDKHAIQGTLVYEKFEAGGASVYGQREKNPVYTTDQFWAFSNARADTAAGGDTSYLNGRKSVVGQFSYAYANKYLVSGSFREDGSMNFAKGNQWGFFPAGSVGWVISEEGFFNKNTVSFLKMRASAGLTGNDSVGGWQWQNSYKQGNTAFFGTTPNPSVGIYYGDIINPNITWEKSLSYNFAIDVEFLKHWNATLEHYIQDTYDILGARTASVPTSFSGTLPAENYGEIKAKGIEFTLGYNNHINKFHYYGNFNLSYGWNKVLNKDYATNAQEIDIPVGKSTNRIVGYSVDQFLRSDAEAAAYNAAHPGYKIDGYTPKAGMIVYKDISGPNGTPDNVINSYDRITISSNNNPVNFGLNLGGTYKGFDLDVVFAGSVGSLKSNKDLMSGVEIQRMYSGLVNDSWTPENPNASLPKLLPLYNSASSIYRDYDSDFWFKKNDFVRLKFLTFGYNFKELSRIKEISNLKVFVTGSNLFVIGGFNKYWDPQLGNSVGYPIMRSLSAGLNVGF